MWVPLKIRIRIDQVTAVQEITPKIHDHHWEILRDSGQGYLRHIHVKLIYFALLYPPNHLDYRWRTYFNFKENRMNLREINSSHKMSLNKALKPPVIICTEKGDVWFYTFSACFHLKGVRLFPPSSKSKRRNK